MDSLGCLTITEPDKPTVERDTYLCCHCQRMVIVVPGSGKRRGWCFMCNKNTCGGKACSAKCIPFEARLEAEEGRRRYWKQLEIR